MGHNAGWVRRASRRRDLSQAESMRLATYLVMILLAVMLAVVLGGIFGRSMIGAGDQGAQSKRIFELRVTEMGERLISASIKSPYPGRPVRPVLAQTLQNANQAGDGNSEMARQALLLAVGKETGLSTTDFTTELCDDRVVYTYRLTRE